MAQSNLIALSGGIGSGKSVVAEILRKLGYTVTDTDRLAKSLMDNDDTIKDCLLTEITPDALNPDRTINRKAIADIVFSNKEKLAALNRIVHDKVKEAISNLAAVHSSQNPIFIETAIPFSSGIDKMVSAIWLVEAPVNLRVERIIKRNNSTLQEALSRIEAQKSELSRSHPVTFTINNDDRVEALLPQIQCLLDNSSLNRACGL
ncbi:MAG: dephospho-CoA kinase [Muribaculaceae bacterium]|nr:dephospho-CoA kinase [Muribaculaceae bacterium]